MGYIRDASVRQDDGRICVTFYSTFGGLNRRLGAKSEFEIPLSSSGTEICVYRGESGYVPVLRKNSQTGEWERINGQ